MGKSIKDRLREKAGFSLTEIIAVLAIIAILASAVVTVGRYAVKRASVGKATATLEKLALAIELYRQDFGMYPPDSKDTENGRSSLRGVLNRIYWPPDYTDALGRERPSKPSLEDYDKPSEILFFFLQEMYDVMNFDAGTRQDNKTLLASLPRTKAYVKFKRNELADTDGDELPEIIDGWGMPFLYVAADRIGRELANVEPHEGKNPESFSLYSFGPNKLGYYAGNPANRAERDYPVGDLDFKGGDDKAEMRKRITEFGRLEGYDEPTTMANKDNLTNWQRAR